MRRIGALEIAQARHRPHPFLQALRQQHEYLRRKLGELGDKDIKDRKAGPRFAFDNCLISLEAAIDQAGDEADSLAKLYSPAKLEAKQ